MLVVLCQSMWSDIFPLDVAFLVGSLYGTCLPDASSCPFKHHPKLSNGDI